MSIQDTDYFLIDDGGVVKKVTALKLKTNMLGDYSSKKLLVNRSDYSSRFLYAGDMHSKLQASHWMILDRAGQNYKVSGTKVLDYIGPPPSGGGGGGSSYSSDLTSMPTWLEYRGSKSSYYRGFNTSGMWTNGNSTGTTAYPIATSFTIPNTKGFILKCTIYKNNNCSDHGIAIYKDGTSPQWQWRGNSSRIAWQFNCSRPYFYGTSNSYSTATHSNTYYSMRIDYNGSTMRARTWTGSNTFSGSTFSDYSYSSTMSLANIGVGIGGFYRIGFDADQDSTSYKSYWKDMTLDIVDPSDTEA